MKKTLTNDIFLFFQNRTSVRDYKANKFNHDFIEHIEQIINSAPTSLNGHSFSAILIDNEKIKKQLANLNKYQKQIAECGLFVIFLIDKFALDFCEEKTNKNVDQYFNNEILLTSTVDATIAATMVQDYALSLGLGTCFIGALRYNIKQVQKILNISENIIPLLGLCIGEIKTENNLKPKLNKIMHNSYNRNKLINSVNKYNDIMKSYYLTRNIDDDFVNHTINHYEKNNEITKQKRLDELNKIIKKHWLKDGSNNE